MVVDVSYASKGHHLIENREGKYKLYILFLMKKGYVAYDDRWAEALTIN